jgi:hypothetical protein
LVHGTPGPFDGFRTGAARSDVERLVHSPQKRAHWMYGLLPDRLTAREIRGRTAGLGLRPARRRSAPIGATDDPTTSRFPVPILTAPVCPLTLIAWRLGALPVTDLWWRYAALGGNRPRAALVEYLSGAVAWPASEHNALTQALNECLWELGHPSLAPYREPPDARPSAASQTEESAETP